MKRILPGLTAALLALCLCGCSTTGGLNISTGEPHFNGFLGTTFGR